MTLQGKEYYAFYPFRRLGSDGYSSLMTYALSIWPESTLNPPEHPYKCFVVFSISQQNLSLRKVSRVLFKKFQGFHTWSLFRLLCSSKRFICALSGTQDWANYHQRRYQQIMLCLNMSKIKLSRSDSWSLIQHWLLHHDELNCLLVSNGSSFCWGWRFQRPMQISIII